MGLFDLFLPSVLTGGSGLLVFGWVLAAHQAGAKVAALGAGVLRTALGDYQLAS